jgi:hypothetical protein
MSSIIHFMQMEILSCFVKFSLAVLPWAWQYINEATVIQKLADLKHPYSLLSFWCRSPPDNAWVWGGACAWWTVVNMKATFAAAVDIGHIIRPSSNRGWIQYVVYQWWCPSLVWRWVYFIKDLYEQIIFHLNGCQCFIHYIFIILRLLI